MRLLAACALRPPLLAFAAAKRKELIMTVRTKVRSAAAGARGPRLAAYRRSPMLALFSRGLSKHWLSAANYKLMPHCTSAMDYGASKRDVRVTRQAFRRVRHGTAIGADGAAARPEGARCSARGATLMRALDRFQHGSRRDHHELQSERI